MEDNWRCEVAIYVRSSNCFLRWDKENWFCFMKTIKFWLHFISHSILRQQSTLKVLSLSCFYCSNFITAHHFSSKWTFFCLDDLASTRSNRKLRKGIYEFCEAFKFLRLSKQHKAKSRWQKMSAKVGILSRQILLN